MSRRRVVFAALVVAAMLGVVAVGVLGILWEPVQMHPSHDDRMGRR